MIYTGNWMLFNEMEKKLSSYQEIYLKKIEDHKNGNEKSILNIFSTKVKAISSFIKFRFTSSETLNGNNEV